MTAMLKGQPMGVYTNGVTVSLNVKGMCDNITQASDCSVPYPLKTPTFAAQKERQYKSFKLKCVVVNSRENFFANFQVNMKLLNISYLSLKSKYTNDHVVFLVPLPPSLCFQHNVLGTHTSVAINLFQVKITLRD